MTKTNVYRFTYSVLQPEPGKHTDVLGYNHGLKLTVLGASLEQAVNYLRWRHSGAGEKVEGIQTEELGSAEFATS